MKAILEFFNNATVALFVGAIGMWIFGWIRTFLARRVTMMTPIEKKVQQQTRQIRRNEVFIEAILDRQMMQSKSIIILAEAVKLGDKAQVDVALDTLKASETQFLMFLQNSAMHDTEDEKGEDADR